MSNLFFGSGEPASGGTETRYNCPFCVDRGKTPDVEGHLYVHSCGHGNCDSCSIKGRDGNGFYLCHRCGATGRSGGEKIQILSKTSPQSFQRVVDRFRSDFKRGRIVPIGLPRHRPIEDDAEGWKYLINRGLTPEDIRFYGICSGVGKLQNRIIIPTTTEEGEVLFWVGRSYDGDEKIKYVNPPGNNRNHCLFNLDKAIVSGWVIVTEGVISAMIAGRNAVASFGKMVSDFQVRLLVDAYDKHRLSCIVASLDGDARQENRHLAARLKSYGCKVFIVDLPFDKDPADLGREEFGRFVEAADPFDEKSELKKRLRNL